MGKTITIAKRDLYSYFSSPIAYVVLTIFLIITGYFFFAIVKAFSDYSQYFQSMKMENPQYSEKTLNLTEAVFRSLYHNVSVIMLFLIPLITMKSFAEERRMGTIEMLFTFPIKDWEAIAGKFLAAFAVFSIMVGLTIVYPIELMFVGKPEFGPIASSYLGLFLMGGAFVALGIFFSSLTENQIVAASLTFASLLLFWIIGWAASNAQGALSEILKNLSLLEHFSNFAKGTIDTKDVIYYLSFIFFFGFSTLNVLETKVR